MVVIQFFYLKCVGNNFVTLIFISLVYFLVVMILFHYEYSIFSSNRIGLGLSILLFD